MSRQRPLSPHLQVYRLPLPALMSITHRMTGIALSTGTVLLAVWLVAIASGVAGFEMAQMVVSHLLGQLVLFGYTVALFYHACNGLRHLFWDMGRGLSVDSVYASGRVALLAAAVLTAGLWAYLVL